MMLALAQRNGQAHTLPFTTLAEAQAAYDFKDLQVACTSAPPLPGTQRTPHTTLCCRSSWTCTTRARPQPCRQNR